MMRFQIVKKPENFAAQAEVQGATWLAAHPDAKRPKDYWSEFKPKLADGFRQLCAYGAMYEPVGTVDHFVSWDEDKTRAYEWENYRFASGWINSSKQALKCHQILDPFEVVEDWFEILLPSLQLVATERVPTAERARVEFVLTRLHLRDDERVLRQRRAWYAMYQAGKINLDGLTDMAPLIAAAIRRRSQAAL